LNFLHRGVVRPGRRQIDTPRTALAVVVQTCFKR
jgi:hypothetical protein